MPAGPSKLVRSRPSRVSLSDGVYEILLAQLVDGTVEAGAPLNIDALARELSVSQTPIREALARLEATGLVERTALKGYRVAPLFTVKELADLMDARAVLEPENAARAAARATSELLSRLADSIDELRAAPRGPSFAQFHSFWQADERFHLLIAEHADNRFLFRAYQALGGQVQRFRLFGGLGVTDAEHAIAEHTTVLENITAGDPAGARRAMAAHIAGVRARALSDRKAHE